jgi:hypothetical protein
MIVDSVIDPNSCRSKILQVFGDKVFDGGIFYLYSHSLRIELSGSRPYLKMFLRAYERSKAILDFGLGDLQTITVCLSFYGGKSLVSNLSIFRNLRSCGITIPKTAEIWQQREKHVCDEDWELIKTYICFEIEYSDIELFLWGLLANEFALEVRAIYICSISIDKFYFILMTIGEWILLGIIEF